MKEITYAQAINEAISEEMRRDENVFMMGEDIGLYCGAFGVSRGMIQEFGGDRIMDTPIAEQAYVGAGVMKLSCFSAVIPVRGWNQCVKCVAPFSTAQSFMASATALATDRSSLVPF